VGQVDDVTSQRSSVINVVVRG